MCHFAPILSAWSVFFKQLQRIPADIILLLLYAFCASSAKTPRKLDHFPECVLYICEQKHKLSLPGLFPIPFRPHFLPR